MCLVIIEEMLAFEMTLLFDNFDIDKEYKVVPAKSYLDILQFGTTLTPSQFAEIMAKTHECDNPDQISFPNSNYYGIKYDITFPYRHENDFDIQRSELFETLLHNQYMPNILQEWSQELNEYRVTTMYQQSVLFEDVRKRNSLTIEETGGKLLDLSHYYNHYRKGAILYILGNLA